MQVKQKILQGFLRKRIQRGDGFIHKKNIRFRCQSPGKGYTLPLTSAQLPGVAVKMILFQPQPLKKSGQGISVFIQSTPQSQSRVLSCFQPGIQSIFLS
jgi:hypothetical protein